jgi:hypothetical protein
MGQRKFGSHWVVAPRFDSLKRRIAYFSCFGVASVSLAQPRKDPSPLPEPQDFFDKPSNSAAGENGVKTPTSSAPQSASKETGLNSVRGLKTWYAQFDSGFGVEEISRCDPGAEDCSKPITESRYNLGLAGILGWGPLRTESFLFNIHYKYSQNWSTDYAQVERFLDKWFSQRKAENFIFPTKSLLRTHEIAWDLRYIYQAFQAGLFTRLSWGRVGSRMFGEELEEAETVAKTENFVPYLSYKHDRYYRGQLSLPFRTEINKDDPRLSNASYSWDSEGRGRAFSVRLSNGVYVPPWDSLLYLDLYRLEYKYASIQNDRTRTGLSASLDVPVVWQLRVTPRLVYAKDGFLVPRVRQKGYTKATASSLINVKPQEVVRGDTFLSYALFAYYDVSSSSRIDFSMLRENTTSTLPEFNVMRSQFVLGYSYSWPTTSTVSKRVDRFSESPYAEEF